MTESKNAYPGLTTEEVLERRRQYGNNEAIGQKKKSFFRKILQILSEPMFLLLLAAAVIYFFLGEPRDGLIMLIFVLGMIGIDIAQEWKTDRTLEALRDLSAPQSRVIRDGRETLIASTDLVPGDLLLISEGVKIPADGTVLSANDLRVDESSLTGESEGVWKSPESTQPPSGYWRKDYCYAGTLVTQGSGQVIVDRIGSGTEYGKIGKNVAEAPENPSPLQKQTGSLVRLCAGIAGVLFVLVCIITYYNLPDHAFGGRVIESILSGVTLAMAMIPEEFPVILAVFLSMGAWRIAKKQALVRRLPSVETLGSVSVLCVDKTGTITKNQMTVREVWVKEGTQEHFTETMGLGCETDTYDPMEKAMLLYCTENGVTREHLFESYFITEYPFTNESKRMGHVWRHDGEIVIAAKGSPESLLDLCRLSGAQRGEAESKAAEMSGRGLRVIAVAEAHPAKEADVPAELKDCGLTFLGLVGLADPPRATVKADIARCYDAGIRVVMITGDNGITAASIARQTGMAGADRIMTGDELDSMTDEELSRRIGEISIFSRVIPEHKMRIVKAFQANGHIVSMTGDGVNDAPALKHADIGIAMGKRGSEVSREAADLILMDDNFSTIVDTVQDGRRIYDNVRKAIGYVFTIHIPIALASLLAPFLNIAPANLMLLPLHVVLLELIIDPTCSIVLERQPAERDSMHRPPRDPKEKILTAKTLAKSIVQGLAVFAASFGTYLAADPFSAGSAPEARAMGISVLMLSNLFLVQVNSSDIDSIAVTFRYLLKDKVMWAVSAGTAAGLAVILYTPAADVLKLAPLGIAQLLLTLGVSAASVLWYEAVKLAKRKGKQGRKQEAPSSNQ